jgi:methionyl-tRNA formyltransferase
VTAREEPWRVVFMGTPPFARTILDALLARSDPVVGVVCQPDRPRGRGLAVEAPAVKELALARGLPVLQPERMRDPAFLDALRALAPDLIVVAAYGRILPRIVLDLTPHGCINVHASLLPRHRGAAPIAHAIMAGDSVTGVCIMAMSEEMDAGDVLLVRESPIGPEDTTGSLTGRLAGLGAVAIGDAIDGLHDGTVRPTPQPAVGVTFAPRIDRSHAQIAWSRPAVELERLVRAMQPAPAAWTTLAGKTLKVHRASVVEDTAAALPDTVLRADSGGLDVATGAGVLRLLEVQLEGKRRMDVAAFLQGQRVTAGMALGDDAPPLA